MGPTPRATSSGNRKGGIAPGDEIVALKGNPGRGMVGHGKALSTIYGGPHHSDPDKEASWVDVEWVTWVENDQTLPVSRMAEVATDLNWSAVQGGGIQLSDRDGEALMQAWESHIAQLDSSELKPGSLVRPAALSVPAKQTREFQPEVVDDESLVRIDFVTPVEGNDIRDQATFRSDRHYVYASSIFQDRADTVLVGSGGEVVGRWSTDQIDHIQWMRPTHEMKEPVSVQSSYERHTTELQTTGVSPRQSLGGQPSGEEKERQLQGEFADGGTRGWTEDQNRQLQSAFVSGSTLLELVQIYEREPTSVIAALQRLELIPYYAISSDLGPDGDMTCWRASDDPASPPRKGQRWTVDEDWQLQRGFEDGRTMLELVQAHERSPGSVMNALRRLELVPFDAMYSDIG